MSESTQTTTAWLSEDDLNTIRSRMPIVYVEAVPVRVDEVGRIAHVGLLMRMTPDGGINRAVVSGRVMFGERLRDALVRHLEKDLGPVALPQIPLAPAPFTVAEYFPDPTVSGLHDPRQHAVSLAYLVPVVGDCRPSQQALDLVWLTPDEVCRVDIRRELTSGHDRLVRLALAHAGNLP